MSEFTDYDRRGKPRRGESRGSLYQSGRDRDHDHDHDRYTSRSRHYMPSEVSEDDDRIMPESSTRPRTGYERRALSPIASSEASGQTRRENRSYELTNDQQTRRMRPQSTLRRSSGTDGARLESHPSAQATQEPPRASFTVSPACSAFLGIALNDFDACAAFVDNNRSVLREDPAKIIEIAAEAFSRGQTDWAKQCLQCALIIQMCRNIPPDGAFSFISNLDNPRNEYRRTFIDSYNSQKEYYQTKYQAPPDSAKRTAQSRRPSGYASDAPAPLYATSNPQDPGLSDTMSELRLQETRSSILSRNVPGYGYDQDQQTASFHRNSVVRQNSQNQSGNQYVREAQTAARGKGAADSPPSARNMPQSAYNKSSLNKNYTVRNSAFFEPGKVFKTLWHTPAGTDRTGIPNPAETFNGKFGEPIYSQLRWMMVVKTRQGYSLCCPISTYNRTGLARKGLGDDEINAHAIVFAEGSNPTIFSQEPTMSFLPIPIRTTDEALEIDRASRIHLGKLHTVEHNVKVADIGNVPAKHLKRVLGYVELCFSDKQG